MSVRVVVALECDKTGCTAVIHTTAAEVANGDVHDLREPEGWKVSRSGYVLCTEHWETCVTPGCGGLPMFPNGMCLHCDRTLP